MENKFNKEISDIAPTLASLDKHNPFTVPDRYFASLEMQTLDAMDKKPLLKASIPIGYFESLSDKVLDRVHTEQKVKVIPLFNKRWLSIAASFVILLGAGYLLMTQPTTSSESNEFVFDIEPEEALDYLIENDNLYLSDLLALGLHEDDLTIEDSNFSDLDNVDLDQLLDILEQEELEELL